MKRYQKIVNGLLITCLCLLILLPISAFAADQNIFQRMLGGYQIATNKTYGEGVGSSVSPTTFPGGLFKIINYLLSFVGAVFFLLLIYAGYLWMTARGKEEQIDKAKRITREVVIALVIIILARILTELILYYVGTATTDTPTPPG